MRKLVILVVLAVGLALSGCAALNQIPESTAAKLTVQQATLRVIDEDVERALRVQELTETVGYYVEQEKITVELIDTYLRSQIKWQELSLADGQLLVMLLDELRLRLDERIGDGLLDPDDKVVIATVLRWVYDAAALAVLMRG
jgi:uncharacterized protein YceK